VDRTHLAVIDIEPGGNKHLMYGNMMAVPVL
jgi:hypothetical protein